ncbi:MAG: response regulator transcription factor [Thermodesulfobacteriota bacterium]
MATKKKNRVMIADDEVHVRKYIKAVMERMNSEVVAEAVDGRQAVEKFARFKPNVLLLDINMPVKSGKTVLTEIMERFPKAFVIMLTSLVDRETIEDCMALGASGYLRKDLSIEEMKSVIKQSWQTYKAARHQQQ